MLCNRPRPESRNPWMSDDLRGVERECVQKCYTPTRYYSPLSNPAFGTANINPC